MDTEQIVVLDYGSQYNQLISRRIREFGVYSELLPNTITVSDIKKRKNVIGIVLSGGPNSVYEED
ncbi:MAG: GMP synthase (glutamine-hydrolyzing), partial [Bacilli bacterium]|nr:GMP synthase (glutamine-hydrolyzing) [Bacilli bacterium]